MAPSSAWWVQAQSGSLRDGKSL